MDFDQRHEDARADRSPGPHGQVDDKVMVPEELGGETCGG